MSENNNIKFRYSDDIFNSNCDCIIIPVNIVGVMGAGLAKQCKEKFLGIEYIYKDLCTNEALTIENPVIMENKLTKQPKYICLFPTKIHYKNSSKEKWIINGIKSLIKKLKHSDIKSIAMPKLGCGLGGLDWNKMKQKIINEIRQTNVEIVIYE